MRCTRSYLVCATQRSGSTLLCRALSATGVAGHPEEYFLDGAPEHFPPGWRFWEDGVIASEHGGVADRRAYLELVGRLGTTPNGVFGAKLMWNNLPWVLRRLRELPDFAGLGDVGVVRTAFPSLQVVLLTRRDRLRQAVSWARAAQEGVWVVRDGEELPDPPASLSYDADVLAGMVHLLEEGERGWRRFFGELGLVPHEVVYEELTDPDRYDDVVRGVLGFLRVDHERVRVPPPPTRRQADELNERWVRRLRSERPELVR